MNKLLLLVLAICLVSVHAFVKRDAPEEPKNGVTPQDIQKQVLDIAKGIESKIAEVFDSEKLKKNINEQLNKIQEMIGTQDAPK